MAGLDDLYSQIPVADIAGRLGADQGEVNAAIRALVPTLVGSLQHNARDGATAGQIESAATKHAASGLLDGGIRVDDVDQADGDKAIAKIFGGHNSNDVGEKLAPALTPAGAGSSDLIRKLLPILAPIVLAYIGKQVGNQGSGGSTTGSSGGLGDILGSILGGGSAPRSQSDNPLGSILGGMLGGGQGGGIGELLGGLLGGKK
jgi:hypothetical protein